MNSKNTIIEKNRKRAEKIIRLYMKELSSEEKLKNTPINQIASALGSLVNMFSQEGEKESGTIIVTHSIPRKEDERLET